MTVSLSNDAGNAADVRPERLRKRPQFQRVAKGARHHAKAFSLQCAASDGESEASRFGLTVTRKVGTATERNRIRRRLRAALCALASTRDLSPKSGHDYVLVARREALYLPFGALTGDVRAAVVAIGDKAGRRRAKVIPS